MSENNISFLPSLVGDFGKIVKNVALASFLSTFAISSASAETRSDISCALGTGDACKVTHGDFLGKFVPNSILYDKKDPPRYFINKNGISMGTGEAIPRLGLGDTINIRENRVIVIKASATERMKTEAPVAVATLKKHNPDFFKNTFPKIIQITADEIPPYIMYAIAMKESAMTTKKIHNGICRIQVSLRADENERSSYGLEKCTDVQEKNIEDATIHLYKYLKEFGTIEKALIAYNWGSTNLKKYLKKNKGKIPPTLKKKYSDVVLALANDDSFQSAILRAL